MMLRTCTKRKTAKRVTMPKKRLFQLMRVITRCWAGSIDAEIVLIDLEMNHPVSHTPPATPTAFRIWRTTTILLARLLVLRQIATDS
jgi:hypothetical protein